MNFSSATESDLAQRIRRALGGGARRMGRCSRVAAAVLLGALAVATLPSTGIADREDDGVDWETVRTTAPENWSQELKDQIAAAGYDVEAIAERVRQGQAKEKREGEVADLDEIGRRIRAAVESGELTPEEGRKKMEAARQAAAEGDVDKHRAERIWRAAMATDPDDWSDELKAAILELKPDSTIEEIAEAVRKRQQMAGAEQTEKNDKLREFQQGVIARAMAQDPDDWNDRLKAAIIQAGWDLEKFTEGIRKRQASGGAEIDLSQVLIELNTSVGESTWGEIKKEVSESE